MMSDRVTVWRTKRRKISTDPPRGGQAESIGQILPRVMHLVARRAILDGITIEKFLAQPEQSLDVWLRRSSERSGDFNTATRLEILLSWIHDQPVVRMKMREWMSKLPSRCHRNQRQRPFLTGMQELLQSFSREQGALFS